MSALEIPAGSERDVKVAIVTGGSRGIGAAIARKLAGEGFRPVIVCRDGAAGRAAAESIKSVSDVEVDVQVADLAREEECASLVRAVAARFGRIDALVNNAAHFATMPLFDLNKAHFTEMMSVNVLAPLWCGREFVKIVRQRGQRGAIVNISSVSARAATANYGLYSASKAALDSLTRSMCVEWRPFGVSVNGVAPGHVRTASVQQDLDSGLLDADTIASRTPAGRIASPDEIASVVAFLLSPAAQHIDGQTLIVDGGRSSTL